MARNLYSARAKFIWAYEKARTLNAEMTGYIEGNPHEISAEYDDSFLSLALVVHVVEEILHRDRRLVGE